MFNVGAFFKKDLSICVKQFKWFCHKISFTAIITFCIINTDGSRSTKAQYHTDPWQVFLVVITFLQFLVLGMDYDQLLMTCELEW